MKTTIKEIATELFMKYGVKSVSMDDIAREAGISKKTIYQHVTDKKTLVFETLQDHMQEDEKLVLQIIENESDSIDQMIKIISCAIEVLKKIKPTVLYDLQKYYREAWQLVQKYHMDFMLNIIQNNIRKGINDGYYRKDIDVDIISKLFIIKMSSLVEESNFSFGEHPKAYLFCQQLLYHMYGIIDPSQIHRIEEISKQLQKTN